jgi:hypothetical protein
LRNKYGIFAIVHFTCVVGYDTQTPNTTLASTLAIFTPNCEATEIEEEENAKAKHSTDHIKKARAPRPF